MSAVTIKQVTKQFGKLIAVNDVSLQIPQGEIFGLLGPNAAGKTTLIHSIIGLYKFTGDIQVMGYSIPVDKIKARKIIGFMPQDTAIYRDLSPMQNILFYGRIYGMKDADIKQKAKELFKLLELEEKQNKMCNTLSGGQQRRVSLGIALLTDPEILIMDEPTVGIDPVLRQEFWDYFKKFRDEGKTIILTTHITDEALRVDRVGLMIDGKLILVGKPKELMAENDITTLEELFIKYKHRSKFQ